ncbi:hypothetical protein [Endothiovibrio diazotrophicus]
MSSYAIVSNGVVTDVIIAETAAIAASIATHRRANAIEVAAGDVSAVTIGDTHDGSAFHRPPPPDTANTPPQAG